MKPRRMLLNTGTVLGCCSILLSLGVGASASTLSQRHAATSKSVIKNPYPSSLRGSFAFYSGGDTNVFSLWQNVLIPAFNHVYPHIHINYVPSEHGTNDVTTLDRVAVAVKDKVPSGYALLESATNAVEVAARNHLFIPVTLSNIPDSVNIPKSTMQVVKYDAVPYRGSKVVLAYNSSTVSNPPKTLAQLISWIEANPGKFAYCNPSGGGSGQYFVEDVLNQYLSASAINTLAFSQDTALESGWSTGMAQLHKLNSLVYGGGTYPTGNTQVLSLLESGAVQMATVWSDQSTAALRSGQLPSTTKLIDITPPFAGSPVYLGVPRYTPKNQVRLVDAFLNFILSVPQQAKVVKELAGFPAISVSVMTKAVKSAFSSLGEGESLPYDAAVTSDMERVWQQDVP
ncbi:MAG TPA: extracellular solute-binding protein [Acidimicrobiales bacterium]|nr:extracellular solute-binding protein [Acidimicrobiales bacterium]